MPLTIRFPGKLEGGITSDILISAVDILPTIMALAGIEIPEGIHGRRSIANAYGICCAEGDGKPGSGE